MENPEEVLQSLDEFAKLKPKDIPRELEEYLCYVAKTGDPVYQWSLVKCLFREKLLNVITDFYESCPTIDLPPCPNVDPFNYETMKRNLLERLDSFVNAPFTVQRLCELLTTPRKEYSRVDKFMRAIEKNILVVSTREPGNARRSDVMQPDFLMNGVMDGRSIDIGEAIETVSSDGVNLMHGDDAEVNISDNETIRIDCAGAEEIDMDDHPDVETPTDVWEKERDATTSGDEECVKVYDTNEESDVENEPKNNTEVDNLKDLESDSKEPDSPDLETEGFGESTESEQNEASVDSTTRESAVTENPEESRDVSEVSSESKSDNVEENVENGPADSVSEVGVACVVKEDLSDDSTLKEKPPEEVPSPDNVDESEVAAKSPPESSGTEVEEEEEERPESPKAEESVAGEVAEPGESGDAREPELSPSPPEVAEEVASVVSPVPQAEVEPEPSAAAEPEPGEGPATEDIAVATPQEEDQSPPEQMEVDEVVPMQGDEPMDQSEQLSTDS